MTLAAGEAEVVRVLSPGPLQHLLILLDGSCAPQAWEILAPYTLMKMVSVVCSTDVEHSNVGSAMMLLDYIRS